MNSVTAAVFMSGNSQAVRLPKQFQVRSKRVTITRRGDEIVLREVKLLAGDVIGHLPYLDDFPDDIEDQLPGPAPDMEGIA